MMNFPNLQPASLLTGNVKRLLIAAYGFEERSLAWSGFQAKKGNVLTDAIIIKYEPEKGANKIGELRSNLIRLGVDYPSEVPLNYLEPEKLERTLELAFKEINDYEEVIVDITAMTKYLMLVCLIKLKDFLGNLRVVYSEAESYSPSIEEYNQYKTNSSLVASFPSQGFRKILRAKCLSSIRMQGQPVALIAFTSFNEQLVRHILGTITPYRLIFINSSPPRDDFKWREQATQFIHKKLIEDYRVDNEIDNSSDLLIRKSSTLLYQETILEIEKIHSKYGMFERIIIAATGSKMQTVGLLFSKIIHPDIHIEYPTPDSYFFGGMSLGVRNIHEISIMKFVAFIESLSKLHKHYK